MTTITGLEIRRKSATPGSGATPLTGVLTRPDVTVAKLVDIDLCIGCKACEIACKEWNELGVDPTSNFGSYQSHQDLTPNTWDLMRFNEVDLDDGGLAWLIRKDSCLHCEEPGCLLACPAPGAVVQYANGIVDFDHDKCIGCQYCIAGCPFDIPRFDAGTGKVYKCTMCADRIADGMAPACAKACPTGSILFGTKQEMTLYGTTKVAKLQSRGFDDAMLYDPSGVGGVHMMYVVPRGNLLTEYGLPVAPDVRGVTTWQGAVSNLRRVGSVALWAGVVGSFLYWLRTGRHRTPPEDVAIAEAVERGSAPAETTGQQDVPASRDLS